MSRVRSAMGKIENSFDQSLRVDNFLRLLGELNFKQFILYKQVGKLRRKYSVRRVQSRITGIYSEIFSLDLGYDRAMAGTPSWASLNSWDSRGLGSHIRGSRGSICPFGVNKISSE